MHHAGYNQSIDIGENVFKRFAMLRRLRRKRGTNRAWFVIWRDADFTEFFTIIGDPIRELVQLFTKFGGRNIANGLSIFHPLEKANR